MWLTIIISLIDVLRNLIFIDITAARQEYERVAQGYEYLLASHDQLQRTHQPITFDNIIKLIYEQIADFENRMTHLNTKHNPNWQIQAKQIENKLTAYSNALGLITPFTEASNTD